MDDKWFKMKQRQAGVTADVIADVMGRDRSIVSRILNGHQRMSVEWAKAFAKVLDVPLSEVLERAGLVDAQEAQPLSPGFSESEATPYVPAGREDATNQKIREALGGDRPGVDVWKVKSASMVLAGYLPGDFILVDTHQSERTRAGDIVIAQLYDWQTGSATTLLRRHQPPVLVAASANPSDTEVYVVDRRNVVVMGKVVGSWRTPTSSATAKGSTPTTRQG